MRVTVSLVVNLVASSTSTNEILQEHPPLEADDTLEMALESPETETLIFLVSRRVQLYRTPSNLIW